MPVVSAQRKNQTGCDAHVAAELRSDIAARPIRHPLRALRAVAIRTIRIHRRLALSEAIAA